ncbi:arylamine N-acetyltransferase family protein [Staphylococcus kloosii]|uniref:arylamine N-acetyltransferase family protein n=1 Tax=Staphylococcus kloosii TaxID=29384 RepID=UPI001E4E9C5C|nr:arylamine N-acetyltransferase [Staphylococcus kloosii]MCD8879533.1 arylamine N-acetyltransferase [Staphylococcus kloosii]
MNIKAFEQHLKIDSNMYDKPTLDALNYYLQHFMFTVPFENIDVQNGVPILFDINHLFDKVVNHHRGGFCYELNTLFKYYLIEQGYTAESISATIHTPNGGRSPHGSHMSTVVTIGDNQYIADVGFGDLPLKALRITTLENAEPVIDINGQFRAILMEENNVHLQKLIVDEWQTLYEAELIARSIDEFEDNINYNQSNPESIFVQRLLVTQPQSFGRATMSFNHLTLTKQGQKEQQEVNSSNYRQLLYDYFGLDVAINKLEP